MLGSGLLGRCARVGLYVHCAKLREVDTTALLNEVLGGNAPRACYVPIVDDNDSNMRLLRISAPAPPP